MFSIKLSFVRFNENNPSLYFYELPKHLYLEISKVLQLCNADDFVVAFPQFVDFTDGHIKLLDYIFNSLYNNTNKIENESECIYIPTKSDSFLENLSLDNLIFIYCILYNLKLRKYLNPIIQTTLKLYGVNSNELTNRSKDMKYKIKIFTK